MASPQSLALSLPDEFAAGPPDSFIDNHEFCHLHPLPEGSIHLTLPYEIRRPAVAMGWAEQHPAARMGAMPQALVMVYAPRNFKELAIVLELIWSSYEFARFGAGAARCSNGCDHGMSVIAGVFYFDFRPVPETDECRLRRVRPHSSIHPIQMSSAPGLLMGQAPSRFDSPADQSHAVWPDGSVCAWDGRLDNRESLFLAFSRELSRSSFNSAMAALGHYQAQGTAGLRSLIGDWSLAIWDARSKSVILASDYASIRPLYYRRDTDRLCWSSSLSELVERTGTTALDEEFAARFLMSRAVPRLTPYSGIHQVPAGQAVRISPEGFSVEPFWRLPVDQDLHLEDDRDYEEGLRTLFREAVQVRLPSGLPVCAELSGGLDSSSIVCMSDRLVRPPSKLVTFSYLHPGSRDEPYIRAVERHCGLEGIHFDLQDIPLVSATQTGGAAPGWWEPRMAELARRMESLGAGVLLTGQLGDFIMGNLGDDCEQVAGYLEQRRISPALREAFAWSQAIQIPVYSVLWRALRTAWFSWTAPAIDGSVRGTAGAIHEAGFPDPQNAGAPSRRGRGGRRSRRVAGRHAEPAAAFPHAEPQHWRGACCRLRNRCSISPGRILSPIVRWWNSC